MAAPRLAIVGEAPNRSGQTLARHPGTMSRKRLHALGVPQDVRFTNIFSSWPGATGKGSVFPGRTRPETVDAVDRLHRRFPLRTRFLFLGGRAGAAYGIPPRSLPMEWHEVRGRMCAVLPHPSGINHFWNEAENTEAAREFVEGLFCGQV